MTRKPVAKRLSGAASILETARRLLDKAEAISLDSVAQAVGMTKPGLMYHFPTKAALMDGLVDHVIDSLEQDMLRRLRVPFERASAVERLRAYAEWALESTHRRSDLVMLSDPKLAERLTSRWTDRFSKWIAVPDKASAQRRAQLHAVRLIADGVWLADATATFQLRKDERRNVLKLAVDLLGEESP